MATMIPSDIEEFGTEGEKAFYPGSRTPQPLTGMSPHLGVSQVSRPLTAGLHKFLAGVAKPDAHYLCWYTVTSYNKARRNLLGHSVIDLLGVSKSLHTTLLNYSVR